MAIKNKMRVDRISELQHLIPVKALAVNNITLSGANTIDGYAVSTGDRIMVVGQTTPTEDGIYIVNTSGAYTRSFDAQVGRDLHGSIFYVEEGAVNGESTFAISENPAVVGTNDLNVSPQGGNAAGASANSGLHIDVGTGNIRIGGAVLEHFEIGRFTDNFVMGLRNGTNTGASQGNNSLYLYPPGSLYNFTLDHTNTIDNHRHVIRSAGSAMRMYYRNDTTVEETGFSFNDTQRIDITSDDALFEGAVYASDISANFVNESLITKRYADNLVNGRSWKTPVVAIVDGTSVTGNIDLSTDLVGTVIDGVTLAAGDRVGLFDQTTGSDNGVYEVVSGAGNSVRARDWEAGEEARNYTFFSSEGTLNADITWTITNNEGSDVIDTDTLITAQTGSATQITAGAGMVRNGSAFDVVAADASLTINADDMQVNIGTTNGTSLEVSATGLELTPTISGARRFEDAMSFGVVATGFTFPVLDGAAGQALITDGSGAVSWSDVTSKVVREDEDVFTGDGTTTDFTMTNLGTHATVKVRHVVVFLGTSKLYGTDTVNANNDYSYNPLTGVVTFTTAPANGENVQIHHYSQNA